MTTVLYDGEEVSEMTIFEGEVFMTIQLLFKDAKKRKVVLGAFRMES